MSFFLQTQRKTNWEKFGTPSPCQYEQPKLDDSRKFACAPFGSTQKIGRMEKLINSNPQKFDKQIGQQFAVNDMNIKIRPQQQISSMFKSETRRFNHQTEDIPGPGQYSFTQQPFARTHSLSQYSKNIPLLTKPTVPSIPVDNLGFKENQNNEMQKVKPREKLQPNPTSYNVKLNSTNKGTVAWKPQKPIKKENETAPGPGNYELNSSLSQKVTYSCFNSQTDRFGYIKKIAPSKNPGPGQYNYPNASKLSHNKSNQSYFNSKTSRFQKQSKGLDIGPGMYFNEKKKSKSMNNFNKFINRQQQINNKGSNKVSIFQVKNKNPGPGQYRNNFGISYQLHRALLKKQATDVFPKQKREVFEVKESQINPGPGQYNSKIIKNETSKGKLYKKTQVIKLKNEEQPHPSPAQYQNFHNTIESKIKQMNSKLTLTEEKPFNTGTQRFKHYSTHIQKTKGETLKTENTEIQQQADVGMLQGNNSKKVKRLVMTTIKIRVPFGISTNKYQQKFQQPSQGPDFYNKPIGWIKPTFNIKGKLQ